MSALCKIIKSLSKRLLFAYFAWFCAFNLGLIIKKNEDCARSRAAVKLLKWVSSSCASFSRDLERLPFVNQNRKFLLGIQMVQLIPPESFWKRCKSSEVFLFSRSNRNDRKNPVPFVNSHSTWCTSASFPAIRRCRCSRHFDLLLFSSSRESIGLGETPHRENPVPLRAFHSNRIFRVNGKRP